MKGYNCYMKNIWMAVYKHMPVFQNAFDLTRRLARALLSRVYLFSSDFTNAEIQATQVIEQSDVLTLTSLNEVFLMNSSEAIWQLQPSGKRS